MAPLPDRSVTTPAPVRIPTITVGLRPFPSAAPDDAPPIRAILATLSRSADGGIALVFELDGDPAALRIPAAATQPGAADELWRHTCFEAFVAAPGTDAYREFNFSPSGQWAAYAFERYREPAAEPALDVAPQVLTRARGDGLTLEAALPPAALPAVAAGTDLMVALAAVVERADGSLEYWAVHHPADRPDFHHRGGFVLALTMAAPETA